MGTPTHFDHGTAHYSAVVTRPARTPRGQTLAAIFADDQVAAVVHVLRQAAAPLTARGIKEALRAAGVTNADADRRWDGVQRRLRSHDNVVIEPKGSYRWTDQPRALPATEALELIAHGRVPAAKKAELLEIVRKALADDGDDLEEAARRRQAEIGAVRMLAELASEVEELAANEARAEAMIHRVRARVKRSGLEPIGRAGDETTFDRTRHKPISGSIRDGAPVVVVRPGYIWKAPTEEVSIVKAIVEE
jgi:hypothetical protein